MKLEWQAAYSVGNEAIDSQHRYLFELANMVFTAEDQSTFQVAVMNLYRYIRVHFYDEEALMRQVEFPDYQKHLKLHEALISQVNVISANIGQGVWDVNVIRTFMSDWLLKHIAQEDIRIAEHIQAQADRMNTQE
jgi:hemerythrin